MGADWYEPYIIFGYEITVPAGKSYRKFITQMRDLNTLIESPFTIDGILTNFHSRMEGGNCKELDDYAVVVVGFQPLNDLEATLTLAKRLADYVKETTLLDGFTISSKPKFYTGIAWNYDGYVASDDEEETEDEYDEDAEDYDDNSYDLSSDSDTSEEDEEEDEIIYQGRMQVLERYEVSDDEEKEAELDEDDEKEQPEEEN